MSHHAALGQLNPMASLPNSAPICARLRVALGRAGAGRSVRSLILLTRTHDEGATLIQQVLTQIEGTGVHVLCLPCPGQESLIAALLRQMRRVLSALVCDAQSDLTVQRALRAVTGFAAAFRPHYPDIETDVGLEVELGLADNGNLTADLPDLLEMLGLAAQSVHTPIVLFIDDLELVSADELQAMLLALHRIAQKSLPIIMVAVGSARLPRRLGDCYPDVERLLEFIDAAQIERHSEEHEA